MGNDHDDPVSDVASSRSLGSEVLRTVQQTESLADWVPRVIFAAFWLGPMAIAMGNGIFNAILVGIAMGALTLLSVRLFTRMILEPMRGARYRQVSERLSRHVSLVSPTFLHRYDWSEPFPGSMRVSLVQRAPGVAAEPCLLLMDASTGYRLQTLPVEAFLDVVLERDAQHATLIRQGLRDSLGASGSRSALSPLTVFRIRAATSVQTAALLLRYRASRTGPIRTVIISFGTALHAAEALRAALADLNMYAHLHPIEAASTRSFL